MTAVLLLWAALTVPTGEGSVDAFPPEVANRCLAKWPGVQEQIMLLRRQRSSGTARPDAIAAYEALLGKMMANCEAKIRLDESIRKKREDAEAARAQAESAMAEEAAKQAADDEATFNNPKIMHPVFSAALCQNAGVRKAATAEIAKELKYAKLGGVVNKAKLYSLQQKLREVDENTSLERQNLATLRLKPLSCGHPAVRSALGCFGSGEDECQDAQRAGALLLAPQLPQPWDPGD